MPEPLPTTMLAIEIKAPGAPEVLVPAMRPVPKPAAGEILVKVAAAGVNRPDVLQRLGLYNPPPGASDLPGLEVAGHVAALGAGVRDWKIGDAVTALVAGGGYAQFASVPTPQCLPVPKGFGMIEAAAIPETFFTVWTNVFERGRLKRGETFLVHGGASGIGTTAVQLAHALGSRVFATAGSDAKCRAVETLGAEMCVNYRTADFVDELSKATSGRGVDVILDMVGGDYTARNLTLLATEGRLVQIAFLKSAEVALSIEQIMRKRLTLTGSTLRPRTVEQKGAIAAELKREVWPLLEAGKVKPVIFKTFPLADAAAAHRLMESDTHTGKIVLVA